MRRTELADPARAHFVRAKVRAPIIPMALTRLRQLGVSRQVGVRSIGRPPCDHRPVDRSPISGMNCLGRLSRDFGQTRVLEPPHTITAWILLIKPCRLVSASGHLENRSLSQSDRSEMLRRHRCQHSRGSSAAVNLIWLTFLRGILSWDSPPTRNPFLQAHITTSLVAFFGHSYQRPCLECLDRLTFIAHFLRAH